MKRYQTGGPEKYLIERGIRMRFEKLSDLRKARGYTQKQVADMLYTNQQTVSKHEQCLVIPSTEFIAAYSAIYGVTIEEIVF